MNFADALRRLREQAGLTQAGLAERSGIPIRTIQGWEQGQRCPVSPAFFTLVKALGVAGEAFAGCDEDEPPAKAAKEKKGDQDGAKKGKGKAK
jgi:transcriptional regulator with XRE-family HTH domain